MTTQRRPSPPGGDPRKRPGTTRLGTARQAPPPPAKSKLPMLLIAGGAGVVLLIIVIVVASSGGSSYRALPEAASGKPPEPAKPKPPPVDVSALEAEGKDKCERGAGAVRPRLSPDPSAHKENARRDLEGGLKLLNEGLAAYKKASQLSGKSYSTRDYERARDEAIQVFCNDVEKEAQDSCDQGLKLIQATEKMMTGKEVLTEEEKRKLKTELEKGKKLIEDGMNLYDRAYQVSDHRYDTNRYTQALKMTRSKLLELK